MAGGRGDATYLGASCTPLGCGIYNAIQRTMLPNRTTTWDPLHKKIAPGGSEGGGGGQHPTNARTGSALFRSTQPRQACVAREERGVNSQPMSEYFPRCPEEFNKNMSLWQGRGGGGGVNSQPTSEYLPLCAEEFNISTRSRQGRDGGTGKLTRNLRSNIFHFVVIASTKARLWQGHSQPTSK